VSSSTCSTPSRFLSSFWINSNLCPRPRPLRESYTAKKRSGLSGHCAHSIVLGPHPQQEPLEDSEHGGVLHAVENFHDDRVGLRALCAAQAERTPGPSRRPHLMRLSGERLRPRRPSQTMTARTHRLVARGREERRADCRCKVRRHSTGRVARVRDVSHKVGRDFRLGHRLEHGFD
jgi:hypothetical protein